MKKHLSATLLTVIGGIACLTLRLLQNRYGFEPDTGLPISGSLYSVLLPTTLLLLAAAILLFCRQLPGEKELSAHPFSALFDARCTAALMLVVGGVLLWCLSGLAGLLSHGELYTSTALGLFYPVSAITRRMNTLLSALLIPAALCFLPAIVSIRRGEGRQINGNLLLLPVIYLILQLTISFREMSINASQQVYYIELLARIFLTLSLYHLSSFAFRCGNTRRFTLYCIPAAILCITALADTATLGDRLFFCGGGALTLGFLMLQLSALHDTKNDPPSYRNT
ncbi:MAG: hypothetical protein E7445_07790 [Ruminococcaceae bacterium]|nr:hypothetical protein [Oscillospiraceae bacterium]